MPEPTIYFTREEFAERQARVRAALSKQGLEGMLLFKIEDMYWLCGLDTQGFVIFHAMYIGVNGELTHITRSADVPSIEYSSVCDDVHLWVDSLGNSPFNSVREVLERFNLKGKRIGVQHDTYGLTSKMGRDLAAAVGDYCELVDASDMIRLMRVVKSPRELEYIREAGKIIDQAMAKGIELTRAGAYEGDILAEMHSIIWKAGGDPPASHWPVGSGDKALLVRYATGRGTVSENDQVTYEIACGYHHYHAANMAAVVTGPKVDDRHRRMHEACLDALTSVQATLRPGNTVGDVFKAHADAYTRHGYGHAFLKACGYTMGATWAPSWMEHPMIVGDSTMVLQPNMTFFTHMILVDRESRLTMSLGEQSIIHEDGVEVITHVPHELVVN